MVSPITYDERTDFPTGVTMKKLVLNAALLFASSAPFALAATQTVEGTVSDSMCGKKHMMPGKSDADCIKACVKSGSSYVLVTEKKIYTLSAKPEQVAQFAGKHAKVQGELTNDTLTVRSIQ